MVNVVKENNLEYVDGLSAGDPYSWTEIEVFYSKELKRFFWVEGSGCSCSALWDDIKTLADMCDGNQKNAADAVRRFVESASKWDKEFPNDVATAARGVLNFRTR